MNAPATTKALDYSHFKDGDTLRIPLSNIDPMPFGNIRKERDPQALHNLRMAIRQAKGVTNSVAVRINPDDPSRVQLILGYGRFECSQLEKLPDIPVVFKIANDKDAMAMMISENIDREDLSISDEITAAQRFISFYDGDYERAAEHLNWPVKKLRGRITLNQCSEKVLDALRKKEIVIGHAEILSAFTSKLQDGTLETMLKEKWTVEYLKERAGKANRWIKNAIFDTGDCSACPHNSDVQASLFDNTVGKAKCNNLVCFREKTDAELASRKAKLEEEHGVVLLAVEKPTTDRNLVSAEVVGEEQFSTGCTGCVSNAVIMQDGINRDAGELTPNQCIDTDCFRKMRIAHQESLQPTVTTNTQKKGKSQAADKCSSPKKKETETKAPATQKTPVGVIEQNKTRLRQLSARHFVQNEHFKESLAVACLIEQSGFARDSKKWSAVIKTGLSSSFNARVIELYKLSAGDLSAVKQACFTSCIEESSAMGTDPTALMISVLAIDSNGKEIAVSEWTPSKELLQSYLKHGLLAIASKSGFDKHFDALNGDGSFAKIAKDTKPNLIDAILRTEFDWSSFAPDDYLKCLA